MLPQNVDELACLVRDIADRELPPRFSCKSGTLKSDGSLLTEADTLMQQALAGALRERWPAVALLGEEMDEAAQRQALQRRGTGVWCIDPVDGTSNFAAGVPYYAVSVALLIDDEIRMGVVYDPSREECFTAAKGQGAWLNGQRLAPRHLSAPLSEGVGLVDLKRLPRELARRLASEPPYQSQRSFGAIALDWCWLAAGRCHVYLHGRQKLWDYAAGCLILEEAGGQAVTLEGEPVFVPALEHRSAAAALDPEVFTDWIAWLGIPAVNRP
jgi:myo-inositol-1(or 4)-monophosphatase